MLRLSSNMTLVLSIAFPCIYLSFFGLFILSIFLIDTNIALLNSSVFRGSCITIYILFIGLLYLTVWRLRRFEYHDKHLYVSNYFKNYRYPISSVASVNELDFLIFKIIKLTLIEKGVWGKNMYFLPKMSNYKNFISTYPHLKKTST